MSSKLQKEVNHYAKIKADEDLYQDQFLENINTPKQFGGTITLWEWIGVRSVSTGNEGLIDAKTQKEVTPISSGEIMYNNN